jgi:hypothetical protein
MLAYMANSPENTLEVWPSDKIWREGFWGGIKLAGDREALDRYADHLGADLSNHTIISLIKKYGADDFTVAEEPPLYRDPETTNITLPINRLDEAEVNADLARKLYHDPMLNEGERTRRTQNERRIGALGLTLFGGLGTGIAGVVAEHGWTSRGGVILAVGAIVGAFVNSLYKERQDGMVPAIPEDFAPPIRITHPEEV